MGVLKKNEAKRNDMIDIVSYLQKYTPGNSEDTQQKPVKILSGGDYMTFERQKSAQSSKADSRTPSKRMEGLMSKMEDFHAQAEWQQVRGFKLVSMC